VVVIIFACYILTRIARSEGKVPVDTRIAFHWLQIIALFPNISNSWPKEMLNLMKIASLTNIDIELVSPGKIELLLLVFIYF
jgi:hypothetical protein